MTAYPPIDSARARPPQLRRSSPGLAVSIVVAAVALIATVGVAMWNFVLDPVSVSGQGPAVTATPGPGIPSTDPLPLPPEPPPTTPSLQVPQTTAPPPPASFPPGARPCAATSGPVGGFGAGAAGTSVTSCPFAEEVRKSYGANPIRNTTVIIPAYSPVTGETYDMTCSGERLVTCTGGNNAVVYLM